MKALAHAREEACISDHNFIGTEQILLGLIAEYDGIAAQVLRSAGVNLKNARVEVQKIIGPGSDTVVLEKPPFTPSAKRTFELSLTESEKSGHSMVDTEHILLALICEGQGVASRILGNLGVELATIRPGVHKLHQALDAIMPDLYDQLIELLSKSQDDAAVKDLIARLPEEPQIKQHGKIPGKDIVFPWLGFGIKMLDSEKRKIVWAIDFSAYFTEKLFNGVRMGDLRSEVKEKFLSEAVSRHVGAHFIGERYQIPPFVLLCGFYRGFDANERLRGLAVSKTTQIQMRDLGALFRPRDRATVEGAGDQVNQNVSCLIISAQLNGYAVLVNGELDGFLHTKRKYPIDQNVEATVMCYGKNNRLLLTDKVAGGRDIAEA